MMKDLEFLEHVIDQKSQMILDANDRIWEYADVTPGASPKEACCR